MSRTIFGFVGSQVNSNWLAHAHRWAQLTNRL